MFLARRRKFENTCTSCLSFEHMDCLLLPFKPGHCHLAWSVLPELLHSAVTVKETVLGMLYITGHAACLMNVLHVSLLGC